MSPNDGDDTSFKPACATSDRERRPVWGSEHFETLSYVTALIMHNEGLQILTLKDLRYASYPFFRFISLSFALKRNCMSSPQ